MNLSNAKEATKQQVRESLIIDAIVRTQMDLIYNHKLDRQFAKQAVKDSWNVLS